jgi:hypothetical protein
MKGVSLTLNYLIYAVYYYNSEVQTKDCVKKKVWSKAHPSF